MVLITIVTGVISTNIHITGGAHIVRPYSSVMIDQHLNIWIIRISCVIPLGDFGRL
jgi:hypothetical protein